jgi:hypothetical protein
MDKVLPDNIFGQGQEIIQHIFVYLMLFNIMIHLDLVL